MTLTPIPTLLPILHLLLACLPKAAVDDTGDPGGTPTGDGGTAGQQTAVLTTLSMDFATGSLATVDLDDWTVTDEITTTSGDASVVVDEGLAVQLNRFGFDSLRLHTPGQWEKPRWEVSVADAEGTTNPTDAALCDGQLFVALYERQHLLVLDPDTGALSGAVDLSAWTDADGTSAEPGSMVRRGDRLYVALERLDRGKGWVDAGGKVVEVDCPSRAATRAWDVGANTRVFDWPGREEVLVGARAWGEMKGGVYVLDPAAGTVALRIDLDASGTTVAGVAAAGDAAVLLTLSADWQTYGIHCADLLDGTVVQAEARTEYLQAVVANDRGEAWISAHWGWTDPDAASPGLVVYDIATCTSLTGATPITFSLAPASVAFY